MNKFDLKLGFSCNNDCIHCVVGGKRSEKDLTINEIYNIIDRNIDQCNFILTGGEPTIRTDLINIIDYIILKGGIVHLQTNGMAFSDEKYAKLIGPKLSSILIAIHSHDSKIHNFIVKCDNAYEKTYDGLKNIVKYNTNVRTQTVITKYNYKDLLKITNFIQSIKFGIHMNLTYPHLLGNAYKNRKEILISYHELYPYLFPVIKKYHNLIYTEAIPICVLYPYHFDVYNQDYYQLLDNIKGFDKYSSVHVQNDENYNNIGEMQNYVKANLKDYQKCKKCEECKAFNYCFGTWKEYFNEFPNGIDILKEFNI